MVYYNIEVLNHRKINFIIVITTRKKSPTHNAAGILVSSIDADFRFFLAMLSEREIDF